MQKLQGPCAQINSLDFKYAQEALSGKWSHFRRVYIVKADASFLALSLTIFERIAAFFARLVGKDYLASKLQVKKVEICDKSAVEKIKRASTPIVPQKLAPVPANQPVAAPKNDPVFAIPKDRKLETFSFDLRKDPNMLTTVADALKKAPQLADVTIDGDLRDADPAALTAFIDNLAALPNLQNLTIRCSLNQATVPLLRSGLSLCQRLTQVTLNVDESQQSQAIEAIRRIRSMTSLEVIRNESGADNRTCIGYKTQTQKALAALLQNHPSLHVLVLRGFDFVLPAGDRECKDSYKDFMNALQQNWTLEGLELDQTQIGGSEAEGLSKALGGNAHLKRLFLTDRCTMDVLAVAALLHRLYENQILQQLRLSVHCSVSQNDLNLVAPLLRSWPAGRPPHFNIEYHQGLKPLIDLLPKANIRNP
ncbi:MAG: hypothetical protein LLG04_05250 [Parachlamydia sp.]|nr:hypothetical protein [Parachlamydia sp.]